MVKYVFLHGTLKDTRIIVDSYLLIVDDLQKKILHKKMLWSLRSILVDPILIG